MLAAIQSVKSQVGRHFLEEPPRSHLIMPCLAPHLIMPHASHLSIPSARTSSFLAPQHVSCPTPLTHHALTPYASHSAQPIKGHEEYHILGLQFGKTAKSMRFYYWVPANLIAAIKNHIQYGGMPF
jgi:hypothetical protein